MSNHDPEHEALLERHACGEPVSLDLLEGCPECAALLAELREGQRVLDDWAAGERAVLDGLVPDAGDRQLANDALAAALLATGTASAPRSDRFRQRPLILVLAASLVALLGVFAWRVSSGPGSKSPAPAMLGAQGSALAPIGEVTSYDLFAWDAEERSDTIFSLRVFNADSSEPAFSHDALSTPRYEPSPEERDLLGPHIRWEAYAATIGGGPRRFVAGADASLR